MVGCVKRLFPRLLLADCLIRVIECRFPLPFMHCESWMPCTTWNICVGTSSWLEYYWQWQWGIRASLFVPQDERLFFFSGATGPMNYELIKRVTSCVCWQWLCLNNALSVRDNGRWFASARGKDETIVYSVWRKWSFVSSSTNVTSSLDWYLLQ